MSKNPVLNTYNFVSSWNRKRPLDSSQYKLIIRQQPKQARLCSNKERDRRPVDPPPIIQLKIDGYSEEAQNFLQSPYYFMCANLVHPSQENSEQYNMSPRVLTGTVVSSLHKLKDIDNQDGGFFVFGDISVRIEGRFRLRFSLFEIIGDEVVHILSILSDIFNVYSPKTFPGMSESTFLSRSFSDQGVKIRIRKEHRIQMKRPTRLTESGEDQDLLEEENAKKKRRPTFPSVEVAGGVYHDQAMSSPTTLKHIQMKPPIDYSHQQRTQDGSAMRPYQARHISDYPSAYSSYDEHSYTSVRDDTKIPSLVEPPTSFSHDSDSPYTPVYAGELHSEPQPYSNSIYSPMSSPRQPRSASFPTPTRSVDASNPYVNIRRHPLASASLDVPRTNSQYSIPSRSTTAMTTASSTSSIAHYGRADSLSSNSSLSSTSTPFYPHSSHTNYSMSPKSRPIPIHMSRRSSTTNGLLTPPHYHPIAPHPIPSHDNHNKNNTSGGADNIATPSYTTQFTDSPRILFPLPMKRSLSNDPTYTSSDSHPHHHYPPHHNTEHQPLSLHQHHNDRRSLTHHGQTSGQLPPHDSGIASGGEDPGRNWNRY
ncbi:685_t:CDS:2 [Paraglomus occultum]|uniref:685_t:CDS:1 n=1 Tax=Paraglomus occultum TaxID=144539 RepID=A0A9N9CWX9_9GLOM|nr:685_t:CDS:2 [Paraglomus occultum]